MTRSGVLFVLLSAVLVACGTPQISLPMGQAAIMWGQARADCGAAKMIIAQGCAGGKIDKASCDALAAIDLRAQTVRQSVEQSLANPSQPVDWQQVMTYSASISEMLIRLGVLAAK